MIEGKGVSAQWPPTGSGVRAASDWFFFQAYDSNS